MPTDCVLSPAKLASGKGASAVYIYRRKNRPYTVRIITNDSTVMNRLPRIVTSHKGMLARKPTFSMAACTSPGSATIACEMPPIPAAISLTTPLQMEKMLSMMSMPYPTKVLAATKRIR